MPPYFINPLLDELEQTTDPERRDALRLLIATNIGDTSTLHDIFGIDSEDLSNFYPDARSAHPSTSDTIDSFLDKYGKNLPDPDGPLIIEAPAIDYAATLLADSDRQGSDNQYGSDASSVAQDEERDDIESGSDTPSVANTSLSESLAHIMVKNGNYSKALEIFTQLNLNNPEKSIYFADQIRFLKKLINNEAKKQ